jgi:hypothetical protein
LRRFVSHDSTSATSLATGTPRITVSPSQTQYTKRLNAHHPLELLPGTFDAAMSIYLNRFVNVPAAKIPTVDGATTVRAQGQTWNIASRLHRGDRLFEE